MGLNGFYMKARCYYCGRKAKIVIEEPRPVPRFFSTKPEKQRSAPWLAVCKRCLKEIEDANT